MNKFLKVLLTNLSVVLLVAAIAALLFWNNWNKNAPATASKTTFSQSTQKIGAPFHVKTTIKTPWYREVTGPLSLSTNSEVNLLDSSKISFHSIDFSGINWLLEYDLIAFKKGKIDDLKINTGLSTDKDGKQNELLFKLPEITIESRNISKKGKISMHDTLDDSIFIKKKAVVEESNQIWLWISAGFAVLCLIFWLLSNKKMKAARVIPAWEIAQKALLDLEKTHDLNDEKFFVQLSDILRQYIERRFNLPATEKTSEEFIQQVRNDSLLSDSHKRSLESFLTTADMVKFARMTADTKQKQDCLSMAGNFVRETIPQVTEEPKNV